MKKQILFTMLLAMFAVASWGQTMDTPLESDDLYSYENSNNPGNVYVLKNGFYRRMTGTTGPTETFYNAGLFAFYQMEGGDYESVYNAYKIYCLTSKKWVSYTLQEPGRYQAGTNFAKLVDTKEEAEPWYIEEVNEFWYPGDHFYTIQPYNSNEGKEMSADGVTYAHIVSTKYMNWYGSKNNYPNDVQDMTVGLDLDFDKTSVGAAWTLRNVKTDASSFLNDVKTETEQYVKSVKDNVGEYVGQYKITDEFDRAYAEIVEICKKPDITIDNIQTVLDLVHAMHDACMVNGLKAGAYYRFLNTERANTYLGMPAKDGRNAYSAFFMGVTDTETVADNPALIWKYEEDGEGYYLMNLYAGMYPQEISSKPAQMANDKAYMFKCELESVPKDGTQATWRLYVGDRRLSINASNYVIQGIGSDSYFVAERVLDTEEELKAKCVEWYKKYPKTYITELPPYIHLEDDAYIVKSVNMPDIQSMNDVALNINLDANDENLSQVKIWKMYATQSTWQSIYNTYNTATKKYGKISTAHIVYTTPNAEYATICVPARFQAIPGWTRYTCKALDKDNYLRLDTVKYDNATIDASVPYIIRFAGDEQKGRKYQFICYENDINNVQDKTTTQVSGDWLVGVLASNVTDHMDTKFYNVPVSDTDYDRYVLARKNGDEDTMGFYRVSEKATNLYCGQYKCYLEIPKVENAARYSFLFFKEDGDVETGIDNILDTDVVQDDKQGNKQNDKIYNMAGQRLNRMQKGLNIVNGKIVIK